MVAWEGAVVDGAAVAVTVAAVRVAGIFLLGMLVKLAPVEGALGGRGGGGDCGSEPDVSEMLAVLRELRGAELRAAWRRPRRAALV